jgi:hypothetical protein
MERTDSFKTLYIQPHGYPKAHPIRQSKLNAHRNKNPKSDIICTEKLESSYQTGQTNTFTLKTDTSNTTETLLPIRQTMRSQAKRYTFSIFGELLNNQLKVTFVGSTVKV